MILPDAGAALVAVAEPVATALTMRDWAIVFSQIALMAPGRPSGPPQATMDTTARLEPS